MKVIDLLQRIANGEEVPRKFMFEDREFYLQSKDCWRCDDAIFEECFILEDLNKEIEIIENKKIENNFQYVYGCDNDKINANFENIRATLENIIKAINEMREDK